MVLATVWVGTPPQRKTVIVDTGSHYTAFPCAGCNNCGEEYHTDLYFDPSKSSTFHQSSCKEHECVASLNTSCHVEDKCSFGQSYAEGSSWRAYEVTDKFAVGGNTPEDGNNAIHSAFAIDFMFGCQNSETGLFITQLADGIMGMSADKATFAKKLFDHKKIPHNMFTMCFGKADHSTKEGVEAGYMTLGGVDTRLHTSPMIYAKNYRPGGGWYTINIRKVYLREGGGLSAAADNPNQKVHTINAPANFGKSAIVDSGTTDTYLNRNLKTPFNDVWKSIVGKNHDNNKVKLTNEEILGLPTILFQIEAFSNEENIDEDTVGIAGSLDPDYKADILLAVPATHYMDLVDEGTYVSRVYFTEGNGGVLGANSMRGHDILFDWENGRVGFSESDCAYDHLIDNDDTSGVDKESVDCVLGEIVISSSCEDSIESISEESCDGNPDNILTGTEELTAEILDEGNENGKSCEAVLGDLYHHDKVGSTKCTDGLCTQTHSCSVTCSDILNNNNKPEDDDNSNTVDVCGSNLWGVCRSSCTQVKVESAIDPGDGKCHETKSLVRPCHTGDCLESNPCHIPFKVHVILGLDGGEVSLWSKGIEQKFVDQLAAVIKRQLSSIEPGDISVLMTSKWHPSTLTSTTGLKVVSEISVYDSTIEKEGSSDDENSCPMERLMQVSKVASKLKDSLKQSSVMDDLITSLAGIDFNEESPFSGIPEDGGISKVLESWIIRTGIDNPIEYVDPKSGLQGKSLAALMVGLLIVVGISIVVCCVQRQREAGRKNDVHTRARILLNSMRNKRKKSKVKYSQIKAGSGPNLAEIDDVFDEDEGEFEMA